MVLVTKLKAIVGGKREVGFIVHVGARNNEELDGRTVQVGCVVDIIDGE